MMFRQLRNDSFLARLNVALFVGVVLVLLAGVATASSPEPKVKVDLRPPVLCDCGPPGEPVFLRLTGSEMRLNGETIAPGEVAGRISNGFDPQSDTLYVHVDPLVSYGRTYALFEELGQSGFPVRLLVGENVSEFVDYLDKPPRL